MGRSRTFGLKKNGFSVGQGQKLLFPERLRRIFDLETGLGPMNGPPPPLRIKNIEDPAMEVNLFVISGLPQFFGCHKRRLGRRRFFGDLSIENVFPECPEARMAGVDEDQPGGREQPRHPSGESFDQRPAGPIGVAQLFDDVRFEFGIRSETLESLETIRNFRR